MHETIMAGQKNKSTIYNQGRRRKIGARWVGKKTRTHGDHDVAPHVQPTHVGRPVLRLDDSDAHDGEHDDNNGEREDAHERELLWPRDADVPQHEDRDRDDLLVR